MNHCETCRFRTEYGRCNSRKLTEDRFGLGLTGDELGITEDEKRSLLIYPFSGKDTPWVGDKFGCVHYKAKEGGGMGQKSNRPEEYGKLKEAYAKWKSISDHYKGIPKFYWDLDERTLLSSISIYWKQCLRKGRIKMEETLKRWCEEGREKGKKYLLLIVDGSSPYRYDPVYADNEDLKEKQLEYSSDMCCVAATFDLRWEYVKQVEAFVGNFKRLTKWQNVINAAVDNIDEIKALRELLDKMVGGERE